MRRHQLHHAMQSPFSNWKVRCPTKHWPMSQALFTTLKAFRHTHHSSGILAGWRRDSPKKWRNDSAGTICDCNCKIVWSFFNVDFSNVSTSRSYVAIWLRSSVIVELSYYSSYPEFTSCVTGHAILRIMDVCRDEWSSPAGKYDHFLWQGDVSCPCPIFW